MSAVEVKTPRGRPKKVCRDHILAVAVQAYWDEGVRGVSINEICRKAAVSKPGLYREFGNEDGLMSAALSAYQSTVLAPMLAQLSNLPTFSDKLAGLITMVGDEKNVSPSGCLLVKMRDNHCTLGEQTRQQLTDCHQQVLSVFEQWVEEAKANGEHCEMEPRFAATYIDAQLSNALALIARHELSTQQVVDILAVGLSVFGASKE